MNTIIPVYRDLCPVCGGDLSAIDLEVSDKCSKCSIGDSILNTFIEFLSSSEEEFASFFEKTTGFKPWGAQRHWIKRLVKGENTVLIAPTGVGKTTLLITYALYTAIHGRKVLYVAPTRSLLNQTINRITVYNDKLGRGSIRVVYYDSSLSKKRRESLLRDIETCNYDILVVTNHFLMKKHDLISQCKPSLVIVDDVDSLLKSEKSIHGLLRLLGYSDQSIELAKKRASLLWRIMVGKAYGRDIGELVKELLELDRQLDAEISSSKTSQLVVASATGRSRGVAGRLLKDLLRVDLSGITIYGRDVTDTYRLVESNTEIMDRIVEIVEKLGSGGLIYISPRHPLRHLYEEALKELSRRLEERGYRIATATPRNIHLFIEGKLDLLVGYSTYYGSSVRGIDSPLYIRYAVFLGTPVFAVSLESFLAKVNMLSRTLLELAGLTGDQALRRIAVDIRRKTLTLSPSEKRIIALCLTGRIPENAIEGAGRLGELYKEIKQVYLDTIELAKKTLRDIGVLNMGTITLVYTGDRYLALIPDVMTYIQASGRTSRLVGNRMTHGLSIIIEKRELSNLITGLEARLRSISKETGLRDIRDLDLVSERELLNKTRKTGTGDPLRYKSIMLVVESPTKAKTIARFFGKPVARRIGDLNVYTIPAKIGGDVVEFNIVATRGHIFDLTTQEGVGLHGVILGDSHIHPVYTYIRKCRLCGTQFLDQDKCPRCGSVIYSDSRQVVNILRKIALEVDEVYIATDPDIEGEKIAFDVYIAVKPFNKNIWRIELHEITLQELIKALEHKREINRQLVEAEMYRRVFDRLVGFTLSSRLQEIYGSRNLGAGRVQTPVLGLVISRHREYLNGRCKKIVYRVKNPVEYNISICIDKPSRELLERYQGFKRLVFQKIQDEIVVEQPRPPYTTDEFLADASRIGLPVDIAMKIAQELFEAGLITYHRTDSTFISNIGLGIAREYLESKGLNDYFKPSHWGEPGAHEAIRPVYPLDPERLLQAIDEGLVQVVIPLTNLHLKVYDLIFRRFIASQMKPFKAVKSRFKVLAGSDEIAVIEVYTGILENGFNLIQSVKVYDSLRSIDVFEALVEETYIHDSSRVPLYSEGDLVALMKRLGIGRPSTYSKIIASNRRHGYIIESRKKRKLIPTKKGIMVYEYLRSNYPYLVSVETTRAMEEVIDKISRGEIDGYTAIQDLLVTLARYRLVSQSLVLPLYTDSNIGFTPPLENLGSN